MKKLRLGKRLNNLPGDAQVVSQDSKPSLIYSTPLLSHPGMIGTLKIRFQHELN